MSDAIALRKFVAPEIIFGDGARRLAGQYARQHSARKVLVVTDPGVIKAGWLADVEDSLTAYSIPYHVFSEISPNPRSEEVAHGADVYRSKACNVIVAIGGGSPMDCAKGIGIVATSQKPITEFEGVDKISSYPPPFIFIPTTAGTSADVSQFSIISHLQRQVKMAIISKAIVPDVALVDPETTSTMDGYLTACTGIDAMVHAIEAYVSTGHGVLTDQYALNAISLINTHLEALMSSLHNPILRQHIMLASLQAGLAFSNAILGAVHAMAHSLGGLLDLPHGECNALLLDHVVRFNYPAASDRYDQISTAMQIPLQGLTPNEKSRALLARIAELKQAVGIENALATRGVSRSDIGALSEKAIADACMLTNPREATKGDIETIFAEAM